MIFYHGQGRSEFYPMSDIGREDGQSLVEIKKLESTPNCMETIKDICGPYTEHLRAYHEKREKIESQIERLEKRLQKVKDKKHRHWQQLPSWIDELVKPIAERLSQHFPNYRFDIMGPFGICAETSIYFYEKGIDENQLWEGGHVKYITFIPLELKAGIIGIRDRSIDTNQFKKGTIGELNGMNHPTVHIPDEADIEWLLQYIT